MSDCCTFRISYIGLIASAFYLVFIEFLKRKRERYHFHKGLEINVILKDYEITNNEIARRGHITLLVGSIMVAASFLIIGNTIFTSNGNTTCLAASASIGLYGIWLFGLHLTTKRVDNISFARLKAIEREIRNRGYYYFGIHTFLNSTFEESKIEKIWIVFRRRFWGWTYMFLSLYWMYISDIVRCVLVIVSFGIIVFPYPIYRFIKIVFRKIRKL